METYTFSRALHMMRYSGHKMRCLEWDSSFTNFLAVVEDRLVEFREDNHPLCYATLKSVEIMGSWVEAKE